MKCSNCPTNEICKECTKLYNASYYQNNKNKLKQNAKKYRDSHSEELKSYFKTLRNNNRNELKERDHEYYLKNKDSIQKRTTNYRKSNPEKSKQYSAKGRRLLTSRFSRAQKQAERRNIIFNLTLEEYLNAISNPCYYCDNKIGKPVQTSTGLDRLNNSKGYELSNIVSCCWSCNRIKHNVLTPTEAKAAIQLVVLLRENQVAASSILEQIYILLDRKSFETAEISLHG